MTSKRMVSSALRSSRQLGARASPSAIRGFATAASRAASRRPSSSQAARPIAAATTTPHFGRSVRWSSESATGTKIYDFEEIKSLTTSDSSIKIIDVREPGELASTGRIPGAKNIPITTSPDSFHITDEEFEDRFGFDRPGKDDEIVFYCKAGVRSRAAAGFAREAGWNKVGEYPGSWVDWSGKGGKVERS